MTSKEQLVTLPLNDTITAIIGSELDSIESRPISPTIAIVLSQLFASVKYQRAIVQTHDFDGELLDEPLLWHAITYRRAKELHHARREYKHTQWVKDQIRSANIDIIIKTISSRIGMMDMKTAGKIAHTLLKTNDEGVFKAFGITKLITKEEELP